MADDLVERLRVDAKPGVGGCLDWSDEERADYWTQKCLQARQNAHEAAARITELEAEAALHVEHMLSMREAAERRQRVIETAHLDGIKAGIEAAAKDAQEWFPKGTEGHPKHGVVASIRALDPEAILRAGIKVTPTP